MLGPLWCSSPYNSLNMKVGEGTDKSLSLSYSRRWLPPNIQHEVLDHFCGTQHARYYAPPILTSPSASGPAPGPGAGPEPRSCESASSASAASRIDAIFPRMTLIASGNSDSGVYGPSDSTLTIPYVSTVHIDGPSRRYTQMNQSRIRLSSTQPSNSLCRRTSRDIVSFRRCRSSIDT